MDSIASTDNMKKKGKITGANLLSTEIRSRVLPCKDPPPRYPTSWTSGEISISKDTQLHYNWTRSSVSVITLSIGQHDLHSLVYEATSSIFPARAIFSGRSKRIVEIDQHKNSDPSSPYHIEFPECKVIQMESKEDLEAFLSLQDTKILLKSPPLFDLISRNHLPEVHMTSSMKVCSTLPFCRWLSSQLPQVENFSIHLEHMSSQSLQPLRSSMEGRLIIQVSGRSRIFLVPPLDALTTLAPFCRSHPLFRYSAVGLAATSSCEVNRSMLEHIAELWPNSAHIKGLAATLSAGEALFVPPEYSLHRESLLDPCISLIVTLKTAAPLPPPAAVVSSSSIIERWVDHEVGITGSRNFLINLIDLWKRHEADMEAYVSSLGSIPLVTAPPHHWTEAWPLDTVKGSRLIRLAMEIHEVCMALVSIDPSMKKPHRVLENMIQGRLLPSPWINEYGKEMNQVPSAGHLSLTWSYAAPQLEENEIDFPALFSRQIKVKDEKASEEAHKEREKQLKLENGLSINHSLAMYTISS